MSPASARTVAFINLAHALDHFVLLIYPTVVIAIMADRGLPYAELIGLSTGAFVAFGLFALPMGWLADRFGRRAMMIAFFLGVGVACLGVATSTTLAGFAAWLLVLGIFAAIYHPVGIALLVSSTDRIGRTLGVNGVWGNLGAAFASGVSGALAATLGWQWAFIVPGLVAIAAGIGFWLMVPAGTAASQAGKPAHVPPKVSRPRVLFAFFAAALMAGGMTFNIVSIGLPKIIDERLGMELPLALTGSLATGVFLFGALTQLTVGRLMDPRELTTIFVGLAAFQPIGLAIAALSTGPMMLAGLTLCMAAIYGQVLVNDGMVARYVPEAWRSRAYGVRYFLGFATSGFAVPLIAVLHAGGGFPLVLAVAAGVGSVITLTAWVFWFLARPRPAVAAVPAA